MVAARPLKHKWTAAEYLAFEDASDTKHELIDGQIYGMSGASDNHIVIAMNTSTHLHPQVRQQGCFLYGSDLRVQIQSADLYTYSDLTVVCGQKEMSPASKNATLLNPTVIIEVLSPSTELYDRGAKFGHYRTLASLQHYVLIAQDHAQIEVYTRQAKGAWLFTEAVGLDAVIALEHIGCALALGEVYAQITFEPTDMPPRPE